MWLTAIGLGLATGLAPPPRRVDTDWQGPAACEQGERLQTTVDSLLDPRGPTARATVRVDPIDRGWRAEIEIDVDGARVRRVVDGGPCAAVADAVALIVAVTVDPVGAGTRVGERLAPSPPTASVADAPSLVPLPSASPTGPPRPAIAVSRPGPASPSDAQRARSPSPRSASLLVDGGITSGLLPGIGGRVGGGAALWWRRARLALTAAHGFARALEHPDGVDAGANLSMTAGRLSACWAPALGRLSLPVCGGVEAGAYSASGFGLQQTARVRSPWVALVPHVRPTVWVTRWLGLAAAIELPIALLRPTFAIDDFPAPLVVVGPAGARAGLSIELRFFRRGSPGPGNEG
ncbi:MAG: hypothetical protein AB1Z98_19520 [Nannocystaceae bacterium]